MLHPLTRFGVSLMLLSAQLEGASVTKQSCIEGIVAEIPSISILISNSMNMLGERKHTPPAHSSRHCSYFLG